VTAKHTRMCHGTDNVTHRTLFCRTDIRIENTVNLLVLLRIMLHLSYKQWCIVTSEITPLFICSLPQVCG